MDSSLDDQAVAELGAGLWGSETQETAFLALVHAYLPVQLGLLVYAGYQQLPAEAERLEFRSEVSAYCRGTTTPSSEWGGGLPIPKTRDAFVEYWVIIITKLLWASQQSFEVFEDALRGLSPVEVRAS